MTNFDPALNPHYDFDRPENRAEIIKVESYDIAGDTESYTAGGGDIIQSPWGSNKTCDAGKWDGLYALPDGIVNPERKSECIGNPQEFCRKELIVNPANMLSLQRHRARQELWSVEDGILTVILDGKMFDVPAGQSVFIPLGAVHCMNNTTDHPVKVLEMQTGLTREKDNIRLVDFSNRPTYPLTTQIERESARLYARLHQKIAEKSGQHTKPDQRLF